MKLPRADRQVWVIRVCRLDACCACVFRSPDVSPSYFRERVLALGEFGGHSVALRTATGSVRHGGLHLHLMERKRGVFVGAHSPDLPNCCGQSHGGVAENVEQGRSEFGIREHLVGALLEGRRRGGECGLAVKGMVQNSGPHYGAHGPGVNVSPDPRP